MIWRLLSVAAVVALLAYWRKGPNAVWGAATVGTFIGIGVAVYQPGFDWWTVSKTVVIGTFVGLAFELLPQITRLWSR
jgi:hypothetical protein